MKTAAYTVKTHADLIPFLKAGSLESRLCSLIKAYSAWGLTLHAGVLGAAVEHLHPLQADTRKCGPDAGAPPSCAHAGSSFRKDCLGLAVAEMGGARKSCLPQFRRSQDLDFPTLQLSSAGLPAEKQLLTGRKERQTGEAVRRLAPTVAYFNI